MRRRELPARPGIDARADEVAAELAALADPLRLRLLGLLARGDCPVGLLASALGVGQSLVSFHVASLRDAGFLTTERVGRFTYARLQPQALGAVFERTADLVALAAPPLTTGGGPVAVVFACVRNAGRSQMAAAWFNALAPPGWRAISGGSRPADHVQAEVVQVMAEVGLDLSQSQPRLLTDRLADGARLLVTMGCGEACPSVSLRRQDWPVPDPAGQSVDRVRAIRDELRERVVALLAELPPSDPEQALAPHERRLLDQTLSQLRDRFAPLLGEERVAAVVREEVVRLRGARVRTFAGPLLRRHAQERLRAFAQAEGRVAKAVPEVLFVCVQNAGRSQMAAALAERVGAGRVHAWSAGSRPAAEVHSEAATVLAEWGIDVRAHAPKAWTNDLVRAADVVVTMGCGDDCPRFPGVRHVEWEVADPAGATLTQARHIRDDLHERVKTLVRSLTEPDPPTEEGRHL